MTFYTDLLSRSLVLHQRNLEEFFQLRVLSFFGSAISVCLFIFSTTTICRLCNNAQSFVRHAVILRYKIQLMRQYSSKTLSRIIFPEPFYGSDGKQSKLSRALVLTLNAYIICRGASHSFHWTILITWLENIDEYCLIKGILSDIDEHLDNITFQ